MYVTLIFPDSGLHASRIFIPDPSAPTLLPYIRSMAQAKGFDVQTAARDDDGSTEQNIFDPASARVWINGVSTDQNLPPDAYIGAEEDGSAGPHRGRLAGVLTGVLAAAVAGALAAPPLAIAAVGGLTGYGVYRWMGRR